MTAVSVRPELPELTPRIRGLHVRRGYPVPWFVTWFDNGVPVPAGEGEPDFRVITPEKIRDAVTGERCWVCGGRLGSHMAFVLGPMCAVNRNSSEPPSHLDCADWSARACPFLTRPNMKRNDGKPLPGDGEEYNAAGVQLLRNPGVALVWTTRGYRPRSDFRGGVLFDIGKPEHVRWYCEGRDATREEVEHSIDTGLPALQELAEAQGQRALNALELAVARAKGLMPE